MTIDELKNKLIRYFEKNLIGTSDTAVESIDPEFKITNKGHGIAFKIKGDNLGPVFYAEQLLPATDTQSIPEIAEIINQQINHFTQISPKINEQMTDNLEPDNNVIITAMTLSTLPENYGLSDIEYKRADDVGLIMFVKSLIPNSPIPDAYGHIRKLNEIKDDIKTIYKKAIDNTLSNARIMATNSTAPIPNMPPMMLLSDENNFADFFYLIYDDVILGFMESTKIKTLYIFPQ